MQTQTFQAKEIKEALALVRRELGPDAVIVGTRRIGGNGLFQGGLIEISARRGEDVALDFESDDQADSQDTTSIKSGERPKIVRANRHKVRMALSRASRLRDSPPARSLSDVIRHQPQDALIAASGGAFSRIPPHTALRRRLLGALIPRDLCESLLNRLEPAAQSVSETDTALRCVLQNQLGDPHSLFCSGSRVAALVGPTGVGKTTTIAKLAAQATIYQEQRVALICLDDHRIGAVAQLQGYGSLLNIPVLTCGSDQQLVRALARFRDADLILIDTPGVALSDRASLERLRSRLQRAGEQVTTHLCLSAATRQEEVDRFVRLYQRLEPDALIATKMDEAVAIGSVIAARLGNEIPFSYLTNGQSVPEDLVVANPELLTELILGTPTA